MTIEELERDPQLPWGFHDAMLLAFTVDWCARRMLIELRPKTSERQDFDRGARVIVDRLEWLVVDPPGERALADYHPELSGGYDLDSRPGLAREGLPAVPTGAFAHHFYVVELDSFIHLCARGARFEWTEPAARAFPEGGG